MLCLSGFKLYSRWVPLILQPSNFIRDVAANTFNKSINLGRVPQVHINMAFGKLI